MSSAPSPSDNRYRALYEASQSSLTDMSLRQREALARLTRFRQGVISIIQQHFPRAFADAEKLAGKRLIEYEDEIILAYLGTFLEMRAEEIRKAHSTPSPHLQNLFQPSNPQAAQSIPVQSVAPPLPSQSTFPQQEAEEERFDTFESVEPPQEEKSQEENLTEPESGDDLLPPPTLDTISIDTFEEDDVFAPPTPTLRPMIRPELQQIAKAPTKKAQAREESQKPIRTVALAPQNTGHLDVPLPQLPNNARFSENQIEQLGTLLRTPKPIFISDVVNALSSSDLAKAWQEGQYKTRNNPYIFLPAPKEYLHLGDLVLPETYIKSAPKEYSRSPWVQMMITYRGHKLYMLGVFFQKYLRNIISHKIAETALTLRLSDPRGNVTVLILTEDRLDAKALKELDVLLKERLSLLVILTVTQRGQQDATRTIDTAAAKAGWSQPFPVVIATIAEYSQDGAASAVLNPGG
jgi:hypothetical protein